MNIELTANKFGVFDSIDNPVVALDSAGRITFLNRAFLKLLGYKKGELEGRDWFETCLPKESRKRVREVFRKCMRGETDAVEHYENPVITKKGEIRIISFYNTPLRDKKGKVTGSLSSGADITEQKKTEESIRKRSRELERFTKLAVGRELKMIELKKRIEELEGLLKKHGIRPRGGK